MRWEDVWLRYRRRDPWVLRQANLRLGAGEAAVVLGRNGVGKSTLLQLAAGVLRPARGRIVDRPRHVGWVPERFPADQPFTVGRYLTGMARVAGLGGAEADRAVRRWTERLGLTPFHGARLPELSKGTAQKVGLAQAMLRRPGLLILDEPWEGLDAAARDLVPALIDEVLAAGGSVLVSDHRGETARLPGAARWTVADGTVTAHAPADAQPGEIVVVEVAVPAARAAGAVARLRADGHHVLRVRADPVAPDAPVAAGGPAFPGPVIDAPPAPPAPLGAAPGAVGSEAGAVDTSGPAGQVLR
ncbi:ATP-binding cassette domain-containing protein [Micromonospora sp. ATCC 39149]|uniref:ABC transporter ATP-binding protein n=1 Tax=Micromonospora carbonacea TaxID=47853 RepID=A0A7D6CDE2_9ACTN|nr:ATP-binding cassette domain-containing protein [Micromonospora sp. ATCC 39149]QLJ98010.1 ABC transporter ATP-binding protein [Micromonospora carbonacea]